MNAKGEPIEWDEMDEHIAFCLQVDPYLAEVDVEHRLVILSDGAKLSIDQAADRIARATKLDRDEVLHRVVDWLMMDYEPAGLTEDEMAKFKTKMERWTAPYQ